MSLKDISYLQLWPPFYSAERNYLCNFGRSHHEEQFSQVVQEEFGQVVQEEMQFKDISYLELLWPFCSVEPDHLCNFGRGYHEEQFCEIILNLGQWFKRCGLKDFLSRALAALLFGGVEPFMQFWKRASWGTFM